jgi:S-formylglutathione hydrolase FrmB
VVRPEFSRRAALAAGVGVAAAAAVAGGGYGLVEAGALPGKYRVARLLGACGSPPPPPHGPLPGRHETQFYSAYRRRQVSMVTLMPAAARSPRGLGVGGLGVIVALHGLGGDAAATARALALAMASAQIPRAQAGRFAVITVDGGSTYWHRRADGDDPQGMILHEVLPRAAELGLRTERIAIIGNSMGGYGALLLAERLGGPGSGGAGGGGSGHGTVGGSGAAAAAAAATTAAAVAAISPAVFRSYADAHRADRRSFDGPADFARNDVLSRLTALREVPAFVACGTSDPFEPTAALLRARLEPLTGRPPAGAIEAGCHDYDFWARNLPAGLTFLSAALSR